MVSPHHRFLGAVRVLNRPEEEKEGLLEALASIGSDTADSVAYLSFSKSLLEALGPWLPKLSHTEREKSLAPIFSPPIASDPIILTALCEGLGHEASTALYVSSLIEPYLTTERATRALEAAAEIGATLQQRLASALCQAPRKCSNALGRLAPSFISPAVYYQRLATAAVQASLPCGGSNGWWPLLIGRMVDGGNACHVVKAWSEVALLQLELQHETRESGHSKLFESLPGHTRQAVGERLMMLVGKNKGQELNRRFNVIKTVLGSVLLREAQQMDAGGGEGGLTQVIGSRLLLRQACRAGVAELVAAVLAWCGGATLRAALERVAAVWGEPSVQHSTAQEHQESLTAFLLHALDRLDGSGLADEVSILLVRGVSTHLELASPVLRAQGMRVGEKLATTLGQELMFDELHQCEDEPEPPEVVERARKPRRPKAKELVDLDPDMLLAVEEEEEDEGEGPLLNDEGLSDSGSSEDGGFEPYNLEDDESDLVEVPAPLFLHQLLALLRKTGDNSDIHSHEAALKALCPLVCRRPHDLNQYARDIAHTLLHMENRFDTEDFPGRRAEALQCICCHAPEKCAEFLSSQVFDGSVCMGTRLEAMIAMKGAAQIMAGLAPGAGDEASASQSIEQPQAALAFGEKTGGSAEASSRIDKTRRKRQPRKPQATVQNRFGPVAPCFFYALLHGYCTSSKDAHIWGHADSSLLLSGVLEALACYVESSGLAHCTPILASDLLNFAWGFRDSSHASLRRAVLQSIMTAVRWSGDGTWQVGPSAPSQNASSSQRSLSPLLGSETLLETRLSGPLKCYPYARLCCHLTQPIHLLSNV
ncbi:unnamed protein product [Chrysoparadoxa australica]